MRTVTKRLSFWLAGYYDDFTGARAVPDDSNTPANAWLSSKSHHGNPINGYARLNPRYTYAWVQRGDGASSTRFNNYDSTLGQYDHNFAYHEWLTYDEQRLEASKWEGRPQLEYPDSLTNANRQKFDGGTGVSGGPAYDSGDAVEGYLLFCNGHNTTGRYYAWTGATDSTYGREDIRPIDATTGGYYDTYNGAHAVGGSLPANEPGFFNMCHLAGVFQGEVPDTSTSATYPDVTLYPITSPSGQPFLCLNTFLKVGDTFKTVLTYDATINSKGDGDIFTIRMHNSNGPSVTVNNGRGVFRLRIGCEGSPLDSGYTNAAIEYDITLDREYEELYDSSGNSQTLTLDSLWDDYDFVINYTAYTYDVYKNGTLVATAQAMTNKLDTTVFAPEDMIGWEIKIKNTETVVTNAPTKYYTLIDRAGLIRPLTDTPVGTEMPPAISMTYGATVNSASSLNITVLDDDATHKLKSLLVGSTYADWSLLMFRDNIDRPIWRGNIESMSYAQQAKNSDSTISISARDTSALMDFQVPNWQLGQDGDSSDLTEIVAFDRVEAQNKIDLYYFGATRLKNRGNTLGFNYTIDSAWKKHEDSRMTLHSSHPIQMYNNKDTNGPSNTEDEWDDGALDPVAKHRVLHARWIRDMAQSDWFKFMFSRIEKPNGRGTKPLLDVKPITQANWTVNSTSLTLIGNVDSSSGPAAYYALKDGGGLEFLDSNNNVTDAGIVSSATIANTISSGIFWHIKKASPSDLKPKVEIRLNDITLHRFYVTITDCGDPRLNGVFQLHRRTISSGGTVGYYNLRRIYTRDNTGGVTSNDLLTISAGTLLQNGWTYYSIGNYKGFKIGSTTRGNVHWGNVTLTLPYNNFFRHNHALNSTIGFRDLNDSDYQHIWVLWKDMRNDGTADANGGFGKKTFGLMEPLSNNYGVSLVYADEDQHAEEGRKTFTELKIGEDLDIWEMDATLNPLESTAWTDLVGASSNDTPAEATKYHDWDDKAGSFLIIDTSKFFNLNTHSNGGDSTKTSGGRKEFGDYLVETEGFPVLIDNYWAEAPSTHKNNTGVAAPADHPNADRFLSDVTGLNTSIIPGDLIIQLFDFSEWAPSGYGQMVSYDNSMVYHYKYAAKYADTTGAIVSDEGNGVWRITHASLNFRTGHKVKIKNSTTTPNFDGDYIVTNSYYDENNAYDAANFIDVTVGQNLVSAGSGSDVEVPNTLDLRATGRAIFLGEQVRATSVSGEWDGTSYGATNGAKALIDAASVVGSDITINIDPETDNNMSDTVAYSTLSNVFPMRLMMQVDGFVENENSGTFYEHDKIRTTWLDSLTEGWLKQSALYAMFDINNIPLTNNMKVGATTDTFGSVNDCRGSTVTNVVVSTRDGIRPGITNGYYSSFHWLIGRDGRFELRPTYGNGFVFDRSNLITSNLSTQNNRQVTNVRVFYGGGGSFVDHPKPTLGTFPRWETIDMPAIKSRSEAEAIAKQEFNKYKEAPYAIKAKITRLSDEHTFDGANDTMLYNARYGYIADPYITVPHGIRSGAGVHSTKWSWTSKHGGTFHPGMVNALDGSYKTFANIGGSTDYTHDQWYYWYGQKSISNAIQVVHVPNGMPKTSEAGTQPGNWTDGHLRMAIGVDTSQSITTTADTANFILYLIDAEYSDTESNGTAHTVTGPLGAGYTETTLNANGFYEVDIPSNYWPTVGSSKLVMSVNLDYLRAVHRHTMKVSALVSTALHTNYIQIADITSLNVILGNQNEFSSFPLGLRWHSNHTDGQGERAIFYAPRLLITDDLNFQVATSLDYSDSSLELTNQTMEIRSVSWSINAQTFENLTLNLEKDASKAADSFTSYLKPRFGGGATAGVGQIGPVANGGGSDTSAPQETGTMGRGSPDEESDDAKGGMWKKQDDKPEKRRADIEIQRTQNTRLSMGGFSPGGNSRRTTGLNQMSPITYGQIKGSTRVGNDSMTGVDFGMLGQDKPLPAPNNKDSLEGIDTFITPSSGSAATASNGFTFPGSGDGGTSHNQITLSMTVPAKTISNQVIVEGRVSQEGTGSAVLYVTARCVETDISIENTVTVGNSTNKRFTLFSDKLTGADITGNTIEVIIERVANYGDDTAQHDAVVIHTLDVAVSRKSVSGSGGGDKVSYSD